MAIVSSDVSVGDTLLTGQYNDLRSDVLSAIGYFGDGSDGNVTISSLTILSRNMFYNDLTINASQILEIRNHLVFVKGTLTLNGDIIDTSESGKAGANGSSDQGGVDGVGVADGFFITVDGHGNLGDGEIGNGSAGAASGQIDSLLPSATEGGVGGTGGNGNGTTGGVGGATSNVQLDNGEFPLGSPFHIMMGLHRTIADPPAFNALRTASCGTQGGGGGGDNSSVLGGGGGGGGSPGGILLIAANKVAGTGNVKSIGGNGGTGANGLGTSEDTGGGGGGGGGAGGVVVFISRGDTTVWTTSVVGGTGGSGGNGTNSGTNGAAGANGDAGLVILADAS